MQENPLPHKMKSFLSVPTVSGNLGDSRDPIAYNPPRRRPVRGRLRLFFKKGRGGMIYLLLQAQAPFVNEKRVVVLSCNVFGLFVGSEIIIDILTWWEKAVSWNFVVCLQAQQFSVIESHSIWLRVAVATPKKFQSHPRAVSWFIRPPPSVRLKLTAGVRRGEHSITVNPLLYRKVWGKKQTQMYLYLWCYWWNS